MRGRHKANKERKVNIAKGKSARGLTLKYRRTAQGFDVGLQLPSERSTCHRQSVRWRTLHHGGVISRHARISAR